MKLRLAILSTLLSTAACVSPPSAPVLAEDADAFEVLEANRAFAASVNKRLFVHIGAPW